MNIKISVVVLFSALSIGWLNPAYAMKRALDDNDKNPTKKKLKYEQNVFEVKDISEIEMPADGDCALHCLSSELRGPFTRTEAIKDLKKHFVAGPPNEILIEDMMGIIYEGRKIPGITDNNEYQSLAAQTDDLSKKVSLEIDRLNGLFGTKHRSLLDFKIWIEEIGMDFEEDDFQELFALDSQFLDASKLLKKFLTQPEIVNIFLDEIYIKQKEYFSAKMIDILAGMHNLSIAIARLSKDGKLDIVFKSERDDDQQVIVEMFHTLAGTKGGYYNENDRDGGMLNHFNLIIRKGRSLPEEYVNYLKKLDEDHKRKLFERGLSSKPALLRPFKPDFFQLCSQKTLVKQPRLAPIDALTSKAGRHHESLYGAWLDGDFRGFTEEVLCELSDQDIIILMNVFGDFKLCLKLIEIYNKSIFPNFPIRLENALKIRTDFLIRKN